MVMGAHGGLNPSREGICLEVVARFLTPVRAPKASWFVGSSCMEWGGHYSSSEQTLYAEPGPGAEGPVLSSRRRTCCSNANG
jgi:hypothetical protein